MIYHVLRKNWFSSYIRETGRKLGLRIKKHKKEVGCHSWYIDPNLPAEQGRVV